MSEALDLQFMITLLGQLLFDSNKNLYRVELHSSEQVRGNLLTDLNPRRCKIYLVQIKNMSLRREFHDARGSSLSSVQII